VPMVGAWVRICRKVGELGDRAKKHHQLANGVGSLRNKAGTFTARTEGQKMTDGNGESQ